MRETPEATSVPTPERIADRLYHDDSPTDVLEVRELVRSMARDVVAPVAARIANGDERIDGFARDVFGALAERGLYRVPFPTAVGGDGRDHPAACTAVAVEELAYHSNSIAAMFDVHCILAGNALAQGSTAQQDDWLLPVISGDVVAAFATSEPAASSDLTPAAVQTTAVRTATGWKLRGRKRWITNAVAAGVIIVLASTADRLTTFIVPTRAEGVTIGPADRKLGNRGQITSDVILDDVELSDDHVLGEVGNGLKIALQTLTYGRIGIAAAGVGMAQAAFDHMAHHLTTREAFGRRLGSMQHWQFLMAERATELEMARSLYLKAALRLDAGVRFPEPEAAMAKMVGSRLAVDIARDAVQAFGGFGFTIERGGDGAAGPVEAIYRDSKIGEIYEGTNEIQRWVIARQILGREITG
ncbi:acyl-CoA dehydrogenase [Mycolicibacterium sediminis]|uniref:Acyl-CoA dehydrogenase n=2 Tax=Mycolicibacterium sediminis TaxID=1286180 RepID=A0A7I7QLI8_9MYCO|nr:acyl-CoA dehydrogenase [Mycolicibacterium sediminis]